MFDTCSNTSTIFMLALHCCWLPVQFLLLVSVCTSPPLGHVRERPGFRRAQLQDSFLLPGFQGLLALPLLQLILQRQKWLAAALNASLEAPLGAAVEGPALAGLRLAGI